MPGILHYSWKIQWQLSNLSDSLMIFNFGRRPKLDKNESVAQL